MSSPDIDRMQIATEYDSCKRCKEEIEPGQQVADSGDNSHPFMCIRCAEETPKSDIDRIRERWAENYVNPWEARPDVGTLLAAVDERDKRIAGIEAELAPFRAEEARQRRWAAFCRQSDVRCLVCDLPYGEREQYGCGDPPRAHKYDEKELADALNGEEDIS